ncbi:MAG: M15 family metallopeptidase [Actinomycetota bacterium]
MQYFRRRKLRAMLAGGGLALVLPFILASHWTYVDWRDEHRNYPSRPSGYNQIVNTFGQPCNDNANAIADRWKAWDNDRWYDFRFHRKLGGYRTTIVPDQNGRSTNLDNDMWGHINTHHDNDHVKSGIWGYACRYIDGTSSWSTHAWGIAIDVSASFEHVGHYHSHVNGAHADTWERHRWYWGKNFGDAMHFQYADNY